MAGIASDREMRALQRKARFVMIENRRLPCARRVASGASSREISRHVVGIGRALKILLMARKTIQRCTGETVIHVAQIARDCPMRASERKTRAVVIDGKGAFPRYGVVANLTFVREIAGHVVGVGCLLIIRFVT